MNVMMRAFATPLVLGTAMVFLSGSASWSCDQGGCDNRPEQVQQEPQRLACDGGCDNRPTPETSMPNPFKTACGTNDC